MTLYPNLMEQYQRWHPCPKKVAGIALGQAVEASRIHREFSKCPTSGRLQRDRVLMVSRLNAEMGHLGLNFNYLLTTAPPDAIKISNARERVAS